MLTTTKVVHLTYIKVTPGDRRKSWRRFRARGSSGWAPRLEWAQVAPRWSPAEEAQAAPAEVQAVESPAAGTPAAGTPAAATTAVAIQVAVAQRNRPAAKPRRAERPSRASPRSRQGVPTSSRTRGI